MRVKLTDGAPRSKAEATINVSKNGNTLEIGIDGTVSPVVLEYYEGKVRLRVYGEDPTKPIFVSDLTATPAPSPWSIPPPTPVAEPHGRLEQGPLASRHADRTGDRQRRVPAAGRRPGRRRTRGLRRGLIPLIIVINRGPKDGVFTHTTWRRT